MAVSYVEKIKDLREGAWAEVKTSPSFLAFKALDDAVAALGGQRRIAPHEDAPRPSVDTFVRVTRENAKKLSQPDAAMAALKDYGPLPIGRLMEKAMEKGANIGGGKPIANFRSALSKDERFYSLKRNGLYFWWLTDVELPDKWKEAPNPDLLDGSDASVVGNNQEGGDGHAATMPS